LLAGLDEAIAAVEAEARTLQQQAARQGPSDGVRGRVPASGAIAAGAPAPAPAAESQGQTFEDMAVFLSRLKQMKEWLQEDDRMLTIVDNYIGQRVRAMEKRTNAVNLRLAVITTAAGAALGWLTSLAQTPAALLHAFIH
jgi:hypothetical protein